MRKNTSSRRQDSAVPQSNGLNQAIPAFLAGGIHSTSSAVPIYGNRRRFGNYGQGIPELDQKCAAISNGNKNYRSSAIFSAMAAVTKEGQPGERKKQKKKNKGRSGSTAAPHEL
jgi:hypothetical protein